MTDLAKKQCIPCSGGTPPLGDDEQQKLHRQVPEWEIVEGHHLHRHYSFDDFVGALRFVNRVGEVAEQEGHHPNIMLTYGKVEVDVWTHKIDGLTESDFILAAKLEELPRD